MSCDLRSEDDQYAAEVEMAFGTDATAEAMTNNIMQAVAIDHAQTKTYTSALFNVTTTGLYRLGIHACGKSSIYYLYADRLRIEKKEQSGIDAQLPKDVQVTSDNGTAYITNPEQRLVRIYDLNGILLHESSQSSFSIRVPQGIYLLQYDGHVQKFCL